MINPIERLQPGTVIEFNYKLVGGKVAAWNTFRALGGELMTTIEFEEGHEVTVEADFAGFKVIR